MPQDLEKADELWLKAGELGCHWAYDNLGINYENGIGVAIDTKKAKHFYEMAAMNGNVRARFKLVGLEFKAGNIRRGIKHSILSAKAGRHDGALENVKRAFMQGIVTKDEYAQTLRSHQKSQDDMKSDARDRSQTVDNRMKQNGGNNN